MTSNELNLINKITSLDYNLEWTWNKISLFHPDDLYQDPVLEMELDELKTDKGVLMLTRIPKQAKAQLEKELKRETLDTDWIAHLTTLSEL